MAFTATAHFPGVQGVLSGSFPITHGVEPSRFTLEVPRNTRFPRAVGDLTLDAPGFRKVFRNCRISEVTLTSQDTLRVVLLDRRWMWRFGSAFGIANERDKSGKIANYGRSEQSPQKMAEELLKMMGERRYSVGELPNFTRPEMRLVGSNPASELDGLCRSLGCSVVLWDDVVSIRRLGVGGGLANLPLVDGSPVLDFPLVPDGIDVITAPRRFECLWQLEAVGKVPLSGDEYAVDPIDKLRYKPQAGWGLEWPEFFDGVANEKDREAALESVFRWYRIVQEAGSPASTILERGPFNLKQDVASVSDLVFYDEIYTDRLAVGRSHPATVTGEYYDEQDTEENIVGTPRKQFTFDTERQLVMFSEPIYRLSETRSITKIHPARLWLRAQAEVLDPETGNSFRYKWSVKNKQPVGTQNQAELRYDVVPFTAADYNPPTATRPPRRTQIRTNDTAMNRELDQHARAVLAGLEAVAGETRQWAGWYNVPLDGAIRSVTYDFTKDGWNTTVSRNTETDNVMASTLAEQRQLADLRGLSTSRTLNQAVQKKNAVT